MESVKGAVVLRNRWISSHRGVHAAATLCVALCVSTALTACTDSPVVATKTAFTPPRKSFAPGSCGASFRVTSYEEDSLAMSYNIPATQDTVDICETWTGSDYTHSVVIVGSSDNYVTSPDTVQIVTYANGVTSGLDAAGNSVDASQSSGSSLFDFMSADQATVQASYDDPYYGVASGTSAGPLCDDPTYCGSGGFSVKSAATTPSFSVVASSGDNGKWKKHGLTRHGVRALVDDMDEIDAAPDGGRRFHKMRGGDEIILTVARATQLLIGEETRFANGAVTKVHHTWRQANGGWVKQRTDVDDVEVANGHRYQNHSVFEFSNVQINPNVSVSLSRSSAP